MNSQNEPDITLPDPFDGGCPADVMVRTKFESMPLAQLPGNGILTHSRMQCFKRCQREHYYRYELGIRPIGDAKPLRIGSAVHKALELRSKGENEAACITAAVANYDDRLELAGDDRYDIECEKAVVTALVVGYFTAWHTDFQPQPEGSVSPVRCVAAELPFDQHITNPETGRTTVNFNRGGKIDGIVELGDGRLAVWETKTTGDSIDPNSDYWRRLRIDQQISLYMLAARRMGHNVATVVYDVIRKPSIQPKQVPLVDEDGVKIVIDGKGDRVRTKDGKKWRESASAGDGYLMQTRPETPVEYGIRLAEDIAARPEFYYARQEIPRLTSDLEEFEAELWQQQQTIREAQIKGRWFRNSSSCLAMGRCTYLDCCQTLRAGDIPPGFHQVTDLHPELSAGE